MAILKGKHGRQKRGRRVRLGQKGRRHVKFGHRDTLAYRGPRGALVPSAYFCKMKWSSRVNFSAAGINYFVLRANSIYDPDYDNQGANSAPIGFAEMMALYTNYRVHASKVKVGFLADSTQVGNLYNVGAMWPTTQVAAPSFTDQDFERPYGKNCIFGPSVGMNISHLKQFMSTKKMYGLKGIDDRIDFLGNITSNPQSNWYWIIEGFPLSPGGSSAAGLLIEITYYVEFLNRNEALNLTVHPYVPSYDPNPQEAHGNTGATGSAPSADTVTPHT